MLNKIYVSKLLIESIISIIQKHNSKKDGINITLDGLSDYLNENTNQTEIKAFIYEIARGNRENVVNTIVFLFKILNQNDKDILRQAISVDKNIFYYGDDKIKEVRTYYNKMEEHDKYSYLLLLEGQINDDNNLHNLDDFLILDLKNKGNIFYYPSTNQKPGISDRLSRVKYSYHSNLLEYNNSKSNFTDSNQQKNFIEILYENLGSPITKEDLRKKSINDPLGTLKNIKKKLRTQDGFSALDIAVLLRSFKVENEHYFIMYP